MAGRKLDIFNVFSKMDRKRYDLWDSLSDEEKKEFSPFTGVRWISGTSDKMQILRVNHFVNTMVFPLAKHPELMMKLMTASVTGGPKRYTWTKAKSSAGSKKNKVLSVIKEYYNYSTVKAEEVRNLFSREDILEMAASLGYQKPDIAALKKELK